MKEILIDLRFIKQSGIFPLTQTTDFQCLSLKRAAPNLSVNYQEFAGSNGSRETDSAFRSFNLEAEFFLEYGSAFDYQLKETELFSFLFDDDSYYLFSDLEPGKRYYVRPSGVTTKEQGTSYIIYTVTFNVFMGCSESLATTLSDFSLTDDWQFSQGAVAEDYSYSQTVSRFTIYNGGDFTIDPRENDLILTLEGESDGNATIFNKTTGDRFIYYKPLSTSLGQTLAIDCVYPKLNGVSCGIDTNHGLITLAQGLNEIEIQNVSRVKTTWDFRFLYK